MPSPVYKGKRITVTMPESVFKIVEALAKEEMRTNSQAALTLIQIGIKAKGLDADNE